MDPTIVTGVTHQMIETSSPKGGAVLQISDQPQYITYPVNELLLLARSIEGVISGRGIKFPSSEP